jgi:drug/metabolite transporter (DMT)-like permease
VWAVLLARVVLHEPLTARAGVQVALALTGAALVLVPPGGGLPVPQTWTDWLALLGGFGFALNNIMLRREAHQTSGARALAMFGGGVLVAGLLVAVLTTISAIKPPPPLALPWAGGAALLALGFLLVNLTLQYGAARLPANVTAVVMLSEILFATGSAVWWGNETLSARAVLGGALIVGASLVALTASSKVKG